MGACKWCGGTGRQYVEEGSSLSYVCPDCDGTGYIEECDNCGAEYSGEYCEKCYAECKECGEVCLKSELNNGFCADCVEVEEQEANAALIAAAPEMYRMLEQLHGALAAVPVLQVEIEKVLKKARGEK